MEKSTSKLKTMTHKWISDFKPQWFNLKGLKVRNWCIPLPEGRFKCSTCDKVIIFGSSGLQAIKKHGLSIKHKNAEHESEYTN